MKRIRKILILLAVLAVISITAYNVSKYEERKEQIKNSNEVVLSVEKENVVSLSWEYDSTSLAFHNSEGWLYDNDEFFPVDEEEINSLLDIFGSFEAAFIIENVEDYSQYGLDEPECTINFATSDTEYKITLGDYSTMDSKRYVSIGDGNVYLASEDPLDTFKRTLKDMIKNDEVPKFSTVNNISFSGLENYEIYYAEENRFTYCDDDIYFTDKDSETLSLDTSKVKSYLSSLSYLNIIDYVTYNATEDELTKYGFDEPELTVNIDYATTDEDGNENNTVFKIYISTVDEASYIRLNDSQIIYNLSESDYKTLTEISYNKLRHDEIFSGNFEDIYKMEIIMDNTTYAITSETKDDTTTYYYNDEEISISDLKNALSSLNADSFTSEGPAQKDEISLILYLNNENFSKTAITFYRYNGSLCLAETDGKTVALVDRNSVVELMEAVNAIVLN